MRHKQDVAHFQAGGRICCRKGGRTYKAESVLEYGRLLASKNNGRTKLLTHPEEYVHITQYERARGSPSLAQRTEVMIPDAREA